MSAALTTTERRRLGKLEKTIERGLETFIEVGQALMEIRNAKLYRASHGTFEAYCRERWGFSGRRARQLMGAAKVGTIVPVANEAQARELAPLRKSERRVVEAFREAKESAKKRDVTLTAEHVRHAVAKIADKKALDKAIATGNTKVIKELGPPRMKLAPRDWNGWTPAPPRKLRIEEIPAALAAHERARAASDEIRARVGLPSLPESATVRAWRQRLTERNGSKPPSPPSLEKIVSTIEDLKATLPAAAHAPLDEAIAALKRAQKKAGR